MGKHRGSRGLPGHFDIKLCKLKRKTEIDFISGAVSKIGKKHGIKTPLNDLMYKMIKVKEGMYS